MFIIVHILICRELQKDEIGSCFCNFQCKKLLFYLVCRKYERINKIRRTLVFAPLPTRPSQLEKCAALSVVFYQTAAGMPRAAFVIVPGCCLEVAGARRSRSWATATLSTRRGSAQLRAALAQWIPFSCLEPMLWATATLPTGCGSA